MKWPLLHITISAKELCQALVRELLGSCLLIVMGCGSVLAAQFGNPQTFNITGASLCWGITVATLALVSILILDVHKTSYKYLAYIEANLANFRISTSSCRGEICKMSSQISQRYKNVRICDLLCMGNF